MSGARYPFAPLAEAMQLPEPKAARELGISGSTEQEYRRDGISERVADRLAVKAGLHPFVVWPEMAAAHVAEADAEKRRRRAAEARRWWAKSERAQQASRERAAGYRAQYGAAINAQRRSRYASDPEYRQRRIEAARRAYEQRREAS